MLSIASLIVALVLTVITYKASFRDGKPTCNNKVLNTYLHLFTYIVYISSLVLIGIPFVKKIAGKALFTLPFMIGFLVLFLIELGALITALRADPRNLALKYGAAAVFILITSVFMALFCAFVPPSLIVFGLIATSVLVAILTGVAYKYPHLLQAPIRRILVYAFFAFFILEFIAMFLFPQTNSIFLGFSVIMVVLVSGMFMYKSKDVFTMPCSPSQPPDYVSHSLRLLVSLQNIFVRLMDIRSRLGLGRRRR